jgi:hypothetical protein
MKRLLAATLVLIAAIVVLFEEWRWDDLQRIAASIGGQPLFRKIESFIAGLPPYAALATFGLPSVLLIPVKLFALYHIVYGQPIIGLMMFIGARIVGTALVARIFVLTQHNLFRIGWFTRGCERGKRANHNRLASRVNGAGRAQLSTQDGIIELLGLAEHIESGSPNL